MGRIVWCAVLFLAVILEGCAGRPAPIRNAVMGGTEVQGESKQLRPQVSAPARIYVQDFGLDAQAQEIGSAES
jgi:PBP1b-binding outer membrane lipoprotein LpoB